MTTASIDRYRAATAALFEARNRKDAAEGSVGGNYRLIGDLMVTLLQMVGSTTSDSIVDVGAGSGRLATALLRRQFTGNYLGTDISNELLEYARTKVPQSFRFELVDGLTIPAPDKAADTICFFSVFTHLLHEESFLYLKDACRVLRPGGRIVISYLDFVAPAQWQIFESTVATTHEPRQLNIFMSRSLWDAWVPALDMKISFQQDGGIPFIPLSEPIEFDEGIKREGLSTLGPIGQSVIVLRK